MGIILSSSFSPPLAHPFTGCVVMIYESMNKIKRVCISHALFTNVNSALNFIWIALPPVKRKIVVYLTYTWAAAAAIASEATIAVAIANIDQISGQLILLVCLWCLTKTHRITLQQHTMQGKKLTLMEAFSLLLLFVCAYFSLYFYALNDFFGRIYQRSGRAGKQKETTSFM